MQGYCVSCKSKREMDNAKQVIAKNGKPVMKGACSQCNTKMNVFLSSKENKKK